MPNYSQLAYRAFFEAVDESNIMRYLRRYGKGESIPEGFKSTEKSLKNLTESKENQAMKNQLMGDWAEIKRIATEAFAHKIIEMLDLYDLPINGKKPLLQIVFLIFLDYQDVYEKIRDDFGIYNRDRVQTFLLNGKRYKYSEEKKKQFEEMNRVYFEKSGNGRQQIVRWYDEREELVVIIEHGSYELVESYWKKDNETEHLAFRPVREDWLHYLKMEKILIIRAQCKDDEKHYLRIFHELFLGEKVTDVNDAKYWEYTLRPIAEGRFNYRGDGMVEKVELVKIEMIRNNEKERYKLTIEGSNVFKAIEDMEMENRLGDFTLLEVKLRFFIWANESQKKVTFFINPPYKTDLPGKNYEKIIEAYLEKNGVKLH